MARILIVEDSQTEMFRFREILNNHGYDVLEATNGADGAAIAQAEQPNLILMDVVMPGVNGFQATRHISRTESTKHIPIVMISSKDLDIDRAWGMRQGAQAYLTKPIDESLLISVIERYLQEGVTPSEIDLP